MPERAEFDAVIAGASIAGCSAARLFALAGARVALVERRPSPDAYKVVCTHQIQSSAVPAIERLGLAPILERAGAVRSRAATWSPYGGWLRFPAEASAGYGITRRRLDPALRRLTTETPGVEYFPGQTVAGLLRDGERVEGVEVTGTDGAHRRLRAALTVAADGRDSTVARLAGLPARVLPHNRFVYFAYWRGLETPRDQARVWFLDPDAAAVFPGEDGITLLAVIPHRRRLAEFRADPDAAYERILGTLPDGPELERGERVSKLAGRLEMPNRVRLGRRPGLALIGDAALAADPLFGVGCGWAFQGAEWLVEASSGPLLGDGDLGAALGRYRRTFLRRLLPHHLQMCDYSTGRPLRLNERITFRAASRDPAVAAAIEGLATRRSSVQRLLDPRLIARSVRYGLPRASRGPADARASLR